MSHTTAEISISGLDELLEEIQNRLGKGSVRVVVSAPDGKDDTHFDLSVNKYSLSDEDLYKIRALADLLVKRNFEQVLKDGEDRGKRIYRRRHELPDPSVSHRHDANRPEAHFQSRADRLVVEVFNAFCVESEAPKKDLTTQALREFLIRRGIDIPEPD